MGPNMSGLAVIRGGSCTRIMRVGSNEHELTTSFHLVVLCLCVCMFFTIITDRVLPIPRNMRYAVGCQYGTGSVVQYRKTSEGHLQSFNERIKTKLKKTKKIQHLHETYVVSVTIFTDQPDQISRIRRGLSFVGYIKAGSFSDDNPAPEGSPCISKSPNGINPLQRNVWSSVVTENYDKLYAIRAAVDTSPDEKVTPRYATAIYRGLTRIRPPYSIIVLCTRYDYYCIIILWPTESSTTSISWIQAYLQRGT